MTPSEGKLAGLHSIRINDQWRIVFRWTKLGPAEVAILDYH
jgi:toxin HigB-1